MLFTDEEVADVGDEAERLTENEHGIVPDEAVEHDHARTQQRHGPEPGGQDRPAKPHGTIPLVDEPQRKNQLSARTEQQQPERHFVVLQERTEKERRIVPDGAQGCHGSQQQHDPEEKRQGTPQILGIEIPEIDVVGDELPEDDGEVVAQPTVEEQQPRPGHAAYPVGRRRNDLAGPLRKDPLHENPCREKRLGEKPDGINPPGRHRLRSATV